MPAETPTILATSGGFRWGGRTMFEVGPLTELALDLTGVTGRAPKVCFVPTACGDDARLTRDLYEMARVRGLEASHLQLFTMPNHDDIAAHLLDQDLIWVWGGSVAGLLAMWRLHGVDAAMRAAWEAGVVLTGVSAGSICWHVGGPTDSFGPDLRPIDNGLALLPYSNGVHYDAEEQRRPLLQRCVADGTLPDGFATDDGAGVLYRGTAFAGAYAEKPNAGAYAVRREGDRAVETPLEITRL
ncbi:peptidase E [Nocardioides fonticola]|uniref:Peptidase E n=1 Tax=Nocardioides fonticola TaxID=450363 RepID=A0ABP7XIR4_9ACTN